MKNLTVYCDGGARGNPGPAASAFVVIQNGQEIFSQGKYLGISTNNVAEYSAVLLALRWLAVSGPIRGALNFILDSELVARQLGGIYKIKNEKLRGLAIRIKKLEKDLGVKVIYKHVLREKNKKADLIVNLTLADVARKSST